jgi:hypothetical protein
MKKIQNFLKISIAALWCAGGWGLSCSFLDVVPDNTITLDDIFTYREDATAGLGKCYSYLPNNDNATGSQWVIGDEFIENDQSTWGGDVAIAGRRIMHSQMSSSNIYCNTWGTYYKAIMACNLFFENVYKIRDIEEMERQEWIGQVTFLKAYYHWLLMLQYGPITIADRLIPAGYDGPDLYPYREKIETCFDYILGLMNQAIPLLTDRRQSGEYGLLDQMAAYAIIARIMVYRACPFYSDNMIIMGDFFDPRDGKPYFPIDLTADEKKLRWKEAVDAVEKAVSFAEEHSRKLYVFTKETYSFDLLDMIENGENLQTFMDLRMRIVDPWNSEIIWGQGVGGSFQSYCGVVLPVGYEGITEVVGAGSYQKLSTTLKVAERFYTKNGLPIEDDISWQDVSIRAITETPGSEDEAYTPLRGILQPGHPVVYGFLNREPRFYADLFFSGSYLREHKLRLPVDMLPGTVGGYKKERPTNYLFGGIGIKKYIHPSTTSAGRSAAYPTPEIRLADLYLLKAEALNQYYDGPTPEAFEAINKVRRRAGIPDVEKSWGDPTLVKSQKLNSHLTKDGFHDIVMMERKNELAFEGHVFRDAWRYLRLRYELQFSPTMIYSECFNVFAFIANTSDVTLEYTYENHFQVIPVGNPSYDPGEYRNDRMYLWPLELDQLNKNRNIIQNPGW